MKDAMVRLLPKFTTKVEKRLLALAKNPDSNGEEPSNSSVEIKKWNKSAIQNLVKVLKKNLDVIDELEKALTLECPNTKCILVPKISDNRLLVAHRRGLPQVIYCRLWRWPDLQSHHQIKAIPTCQSCSESKPNGIERLNPSYLVCVNPYHYERKKPSTLEPVIVRCSQIPPDLSTSFEDSDPSAGGTRAVPNTIRLATTTNIATPNVNQTISPAMTTSNASQLIEPQPSTSQHPTTAIHQSPPQQQHLQQQQQQQQILQQQQRLNQQAAANQHYQQNQPYQPQQHPRQQYYTPLAMQQPSDHNLGPQATPLRPLLGPVTGSQTEVATPYRFKQAKYSHQTRSVHDSRAYASSQQYIPAQQATPSQQPLMYQSSMPQPQQQPQQQPQYTQQQYQSQQCQYSQYEQPPPGSPYPLESERMLDDPNYYTNQTHQQDPMISGYQQPQQQQHQQLDVPIVYQGSEQEYYKPLVGPTGCQQVGYDTTSYDQQAPVYEPYDPTMMPSTSYAPDQCMARSNATMRPIMTNTNQAMDVGIGSRQMMMASPGRTLEVPVMIGGRPQIDYREIPYVEGDIWCSIEYHEYAVKVGTKFNCRSKSVIVDGYTQPVCSDRLCVGGFTNVNRNEFTEWVRRRIGNGVKLTHVDGQVYVECLSDSSVFVSCPLNGLTEVEQESVTKLSNGESFTVFDNGTFSRLLSLASERGFESVYKLTNHCSFRISFVKGWGREYKRQSVLNVPSWIEVQLNGPLQWIDKVLRQLKPPVGCGSTS